jgi:hypothetical protein
MSIEPSPDIKFSAEPPNGARMGMGGVEVVRCDGGRRRRFLVRAGRCIGGRLEDDVVYGIMYLCVWLLCILHGNTLRFYQVYRSVGIVVIDKSNFGHLL